MRYGRTRRSSFKTPKPKKLKPMVRVRQRAAKTGGKCAACKGRYEKGDAITVVIVKQRKYHTATCVPANVGTMPVAGNAVAPTPDDVVKALASTWAEGEAKMVAMLALENALVVVAKSKGITPEMEKAFDRYNKLKAMAMRPGSKNEGEMAARQAILDVVKVVF